MKGSILVSGIWGDGGTSKDGTISCVSLFAVLTFLYARQYGDGALLSDNLGALQYGGGA